MNTSLHCFCLSVALLHYLSHTCEHSQGRARQASLAGMYRHWRGIVVCWLLNVPATCYSVSQGRICSDNFTCCHTKIEDADQTFYPTQSQYTDTGPTSPSADPITPGAWQGSHWNANFEVTGMTRPGKNSSRKRDSNPGSSALEADALTTRPTRRSGRGSCS